VKTLGQYLEASSSYYSRSSDSRLAENHKVHRTLVKTTNTPFVDGINVTLIVSSLTTYKGLYSF